MRLHHVQVACPPGGEDGARRFYGAGLGMTEVEKPEALRARGWVHGSSLRRGATWAEIHVGVEEPFVPARKAHPALLLDRRHGARGDRRTAGVGMGYDVEPDAARHLPRITSGSTPSTVTATASSCSPELRTG